MTDAPLALPPGVTLPRDADGAWLISLRYNGRLEGANRVADGYCLNRDDVTATIDAMEANAVRANGAIYVNGWTVNWYERRPD